MMRDMNSVHLTAPAPTEHTSRVSVFERAARLIVRYRWTVLIGYVISLVILGLVIARAVNVFT